MKMPGLLVENCFITSDKYLHCKRRASVSQAWHVPIVRVHGNDCDK